MNQDQATQNHTIPTDSPFHLDREKYLAIFQSEGLSAALTQLHLDTERLEHETFEGREGWQPELFEYLKKVREFSRELWGKRPTTVEPFRHPTAPRR
jgi:hypothetical protein